MQLMVVFADNNADNIDKRVILVFNQWVVPYQNITILDDVFEISDRKDNPDGLILTNGEENIILRKDQPQKKFGYQFEVVEYRFDLDRIHRKSPEGTPLYGMIDNETRRILHSYHLQAILVKPIIEFSRKINNESVSKRSNNLFKEEINTELNVELELLNHGKDDAEFIHKEHIHENFEIYNIKTNSGTARLENDDSGRFIRVQGNTNRNIKLSYTLKTLEDTIFTFDSKTHIKYEGRDYYFGERNKTKLEITSGINFRGGFHNFRDYQLREMRLEIGETQRYGIVLENSHDKNMTGIKLFIEFPDENSLITENNERIYENTISRELTLEANTKKEISFNVTLFYTGIYTIPARVEYEVNGVKKKEEFESIIEIRFNPLHPSVLFNSTRSNRTHDMLMYLSNSNKISEIRNLDVYVKAQLNNEVEEYQYFFRKVDIRSTLLLNRLVRKVENPEIDNIFIHGTFNTIYGELISFNSTTTPVEGYRKDYISRLNSISSQNNLDLMYDERIFEEKMSPFLEKLLVITGLVVNEDNEHSIYIMPIFLLVLFLSIQGIIMFAQKKKEKKDNKK